MSFLKVGLLLVCSATMVACAATKEGTDASGGDDTAVTQAGYAEYKACAKKQEPEKVWEMCGELLGLE